MPAGFLLSWKPTGKTFSSTSLPIGATHHFWTSANPSRKSVDFLVVTRLTPDVGREGLGHLVQKPSRRRSPMDLREEPDEVHQLRCLVEDLRKGKLFLAKGDHWPTSHWLTWIRSFLSKLHCFPLKIDVPRSQHGQPTPFSTHHLPNKGGLMRPRRKNRKQRIAIIWN